MQQTCHRCGGELPEGSGETPFCPHCGAPQLFLALENQSVPIQGENAGVSTTGAAAPPRPQIVDWKTAIRCAAAVGAVGAVLRLAAIKVNVLLPVSMLWILCASLITMGFYQNRKPTAWMDLRIGARIGVVVGLCLAVEIGVLFSGAGLIKRFVLHSMGGSDAQLIATIIESQRLAAQITATPIPPDVLALERTPEFSAWYVLSEFAMGTLILLMLSMVGGAFAGLLRTRRGTAA